MILRSLVLSCLSHDLRNNPLSLSLCVSFSLHTQQHKYAFTEKGKSVDIRLAHTTSEDDEISVNVMDRPLHGALHFPDREEPLITFTPEADFTGKDSFHYEVCRTRNGNRACTQTQVTIIVRIDVNDDQITTMEGQQVTNPSLLPSREHNTCHVVAKHLN